MSRLRWFASKNGRKLTHFSVTCLIGGVCTYNYVPQTFLIDKYTEIYHLYKSGFQAPLQDGLQEKMDKCAELLHLSKLYKEKLRAFPVFGFDLFRAGCFSTRFGVAIGIPQTFTYNHTDDIDKDIIQVNWKSIDWSSEVGNQLAESLVLTEKEKLFGICRELFMANTMKITIDTAVPGMFIVGTYIINTSMNMHLKLLQRPPIFRLVLYTLSSLFGLGMYFFVTDYTQVDYECRTDEKLCELGPDFVEAGVGFYTKLINRNVALRTLMGESGESMYTAHGNNNDLFRYKTLPLTIRKLFFETKLKELREKELQSGEEESQDNSELNKLLQRNII